MKRFGAIVLCCIMATAAEAGGFAVRDFSASGLGVANAMVAGADDVSAVAYNPSALAWQDGIAGMVDINVRYRNSSVDLGTGVAPNVGGESNPQNLYLLWMPHETDFGISLGYNRPYAFDNYWITTGLTGKTALTINRVTLDGIYRISSSLAVAAGADWYIASATMLQGGNQFSGKGYSSFGGHLSAKWKPAPTWSIGALARLGANIKMSDSLNQSMRLKLPDEFTLGVAKDLDDSVRLELDADWSRWSRVKDMNLVAGGAVVQANTFDLKDTFSVMAGLTWFWREKSQVRLGYAYEQGANSSAGFNPVVADQSGHKVALGIGGDVFGVHADFSYAYTFYPKFTASGAFAGSYRDRRHGLSVSVSKAL